MPLHTGLTGAVILTVGDDDTALAMHSGDVPVLATPRVVALMEEATVLAINGHLPAGHTTVGVRVQLDHVAPTAVGQDVRAEAQLDKIDGRRLTFTVTVTDGRGLAAAGKVTRVLVELDRFLEKTQ